MINWKRKAVFLLLSWWRPRTQQTVPTLESLEKALHDAYHQGSKDATNRRLKHNDP